MSLRAITVSTRAALRSMPADAERICGAAHELLAQLEFDTLGNGAEPALLREIEAARRALWDPPIGESRDGPNQAIRH